MTYPDLPEWDGLPWSLLLTPPWRELSGRSAPEIVAAQWSTATRYLLDNLEHLPPDQWCVASYQALVDDPRGEVERICRFVGLDWDREIESPLPLSRSTLTAPSAVNRRDRRLPPLRRRSSGDLRHPGPARCATSGASRARRSRGRRGVRSAAASGGSETVARVSEARGLRMRGSTSRSVRALARVAAAILLSTAALAEEGVFTTWPATDPTDFGSTWLDPANAATAERGEWTCSVSVAYFNAFRESGELAALREESGRRGRVTAGELQELEQRFPARDLFAIDMEGFVTEVRVRRGFSPSLSAWIRIPVISTGSPNWDSAAELAHDTFGVGTKGRDLFPRGETLLYLRAGESGLFETSNLEMNRLGDLEAGLTWRRGAHRVLLSADGSTSDSRLGSSGGIDAGLGYFYLRDVGAVSMTAGAGYARLDPGGSFLGIERSDTWHLAGRLEAPVWREITFLGGARLDSSPLAGASEGEMAEPGLTIDLAFAGAFGPLRGSIHFLEDFPSTGVSADWSFLLTVTYGR